MREESRRQMEQKDEGHGMKITIAYLPEEQQEVAAGVAALRQLQPGLKVRKSDRHKPFSHLYLTTRKPAKPTDTGGST